MGSSYGPQVHDECDEVGTADEISLKLYGLTEAELDWLQLGAATNHHPRQRRRRKRLARICISLFRSHNSLRAC